MYLKITQIVILSLIIIKVFTVTALTTSNCPNDYDINNYNTTTS